MRWRRFFGKDEDDYTFEAPQTGALAHVSDVVSLRGSEMDNGTITDLVAYFVNHGDKGCYGLILECPTEASESFGAYLGAHCQQFYLSRNGKITVQDKQAVWLQPYRLLYFLKRCR